MPSIEQKYEALFERQLEVLEHRACPYRIISAARKRKYDVLGRAMEMEEEGMFEPKDVRAGLLLPFLPVIPQSILPIPTLTSMIQFKMRHARSRIANTEVEDSTPLPTALYYAYGIVCYRGTIMTAQRYMLSHNLCASTVAEMIAASIYAGWLLLEQNCFEAPASRCKKQSEMGSELVPFVHILYGEPWVDWIDVHSSRAGMLILGCIERMAF